MPKDRRSPSLDRCRVSPYSRKYQYDRKTRPRTPSLPIGNKNDWEETRCPICMEHPHNAVLLLCSSREKGCLPYMCSTSSRHSNCLDQFRKSSMNADNLQEVNREGETKLVCPLCRGQINGCIVVKRAREFMDSKVRSCSLGTCVFSGDYSQLRKHARCAHPNVRPTDVDPELELRWRILEEESARQDMLSIQFEYVDDDDDDAEDDDEDDEGHAIEESMNGVVPDLNLPALNLPSGWENDFSSSLFLLPTGPDSFFSDIDIDADSTLYFDNLFPEFDFVSGPAPTHNRLPVSSIDHSLTYFNNRLLARPRENGPTYTHNRLPERAREYGPFDTNIRLSERPRSYGQTDTRNMLSERPRRYGPSDGHNRPSEEARSRSNTHRRRGSNSQPSSRNANRDREEQLLTTIVEFHDLSSN